jgi:hypothetical protein
VRSPKGTNCYRHTSPTRFLSTFSSANRLRIAKEIDAAQAETVKAIAADSPYRPVLETAPSYLRDARRGYARCRCVCEVALELESNRASEKFSRSASRPRTQRKTRVLTGRLTGDFERRRFGQLECKTAVRPLAAVVLDADAQHSFEMPATESPITQWPSTALGRHGSRVLTADVEVTLPLSRRHLLLLSHFDWYQGRCCVAAEESMVGETGMAEAAR